jgi:hypothetical protein
MNAMRMPLRSTALKIDLPGSCLLLFKRQMANQLAVSPY